AIAAAGSLGVDGTLAVVIAPRSSSTSTKSVNVPPVSMPRTTLTREAPQRLVSRLSSASHFPLARRPRVAITVTLKCPTVQQPAGAGIREWRLHQNAPSRAARA